METKEIIETSESLQNSSKDLDNTIVEESESFKQPIKYSDNIIVRESENKRWYILRAFTGQEQRAVNELVKKLEMYDLIDKLVEICTPKEQMVVLEGNNTKHKQESFYPGYVFVAFDIKHEKEIHDVAQLFMKVHQQMCQVTQVEVDRMKELSKHSIEAPTTAINVKEGQQVRVIAGSYIDMTGKVDKIDIEEKKVTVKLAIFDREIDVVLNIDQIQSDR